MRRHKYLFLMLMLTLTLLLALPAALPAASPAGSVRAATPPDGEPVRQENSASEMLQGIPGASDNWWAAAQEDIQQSEYNIIIGAPYYDNEQTDEGRAYGYYGGVSSLGLSPKVNWIVESDQANALFGWAVGTAGDVNGDGADDVIIGAPSYDNAQTDEGRAYVYHGSTGGVSRTAD